MKENFADIVYSCKYKGKTDIQISLLFEHKSYPVKRPHIQLLKYLLKIWDANVKQKTELIPVIPIIFYHGKKRWKQRLFEDYFEGIDENLKQFLPSFNYILNDLSQYTDEEIAKKYHEIKTRTALLLMKNIFDDEVLKKKAPFIFYGSQQLVNTETGEKFFTTTIFYLLDHMEKEFEEITETIKTITNKGGDIAMTIAMQLKQKGKQEGIQEGIQKGVYETRKETIIKLFTKAGFTVDQIVEYLELDNDFVEKILKEAKLK